MGATHAGPIGCPQCPPPESRKRDDGNPFLPSNANNANVDTSGYRWDAPPPQPCGGSEDGSSSVGSGGGSCSSCCSCCKSSFSTKALARCGCYESATRSKACTGRCKGCCRQAGSLGCAFPFDQRPEQSPLRKHFLSANYTHGREMDCDGTGYAEELWEGIIPVYEHLDLDIRVWAEAVQFVSPGAADAEVFFHYLSEDDFRAVAGAPTVTPELWKRLLTSTEKHGISFPVCSLPFDGGAEPSEPSDVSDGSDDVKEVVNSSSSAKSNNAAADANARSEGFGSKAATTTTPARDAARPAGTIGVREAMAMPQHIPEMGHNDIQQQQHHQHRRRNLDLSASSSLPETFAPAERTAGAATAAERTAGAGTAAATSATNVNGVVVTVWEPGQWESPLPEPKDGDHSLPMPSERRFCIAILAPRSLALCGSSSARLGTSDEATQQGSPREFWAVLRSQEPSKQLQVATRRREQRLRRALHLAETASEASGLKASPAMLGRMLSLAALLEATERSGEAESLYLRILQGDQSLTSENMAKAFKALSRLTAILQGSQRLEEAEKLHRQMLTSCEQCLGKEHPDTLTTTYNLAQLLRAQGREGQAEPLLRHVLAQREALFGPDHPSVASCVHRLADVLVALHCHAEAEQLYYRAQTWYEHFQSEGHPETLSVLNSLATLLQSQGRHQEAEPLLRRVLTWREDHLGALHMTTLASKNNLAFLLHSLGSFAEAEELYRHCWDVYSKQVGSNHPNTLTTVHNLAQLVYQCDRLEESEPLCRSAFEGSLQELGLEHGSTLQAAARLASVLQRLDKLEEARDILTRVLPYFGIEPGVADDLDTLAVASLLASVLVKQGEYKEAENIYRKVLFGRRLHLGTTHPDIAETLKDLAETLQLSGRLKDAAFFFQEALDQAEILSGTESQESLYLVGRLAHILTLQKNHKEAEWYYLRELKWREHRLFEADCSDTYPVLMNLAQGAKAMGKLSQAQDYCRWALRVSDLRLGVDDPTSLQCCSSLAGLLHTDGKLQDAEVLYRRVWQGRSRTYGSRDVRTVGSVRKLAYCLQDQGKLDEVAELCEEVLEDLQETLLVGSQVSDADDEIRAIGASLLLLLQASKASATPLTNQIPGIYPGQAHLGQPITEKRQDAADGNRINPDNSNSNNSNEHAGTSASEVRGYSPRHGGTDIINNDNINNASSSNNNDNSNMKSNAGSSNNANMSKGKGTDEEEEKKKKKKEKKDEEDVLSNIDDHHCGGALGSSHQSAGRRTPRDAHHHSPRPISASTGECPECFEFSEADDRTSKAEVQPIKPAKIAEGRGCWQQVGRVAAKCCSSS